MVNTLYRIREKFAKHKFDPASRDDLKIYKHFLETGSWGHDTCPFELEWPWLNIPDMISHKIAVAAVAKV